MALACVRMRSGPPLRRAFFERSSVEVARDLVGATLIRKLADGTRLAGRLVEVEAYLGDGSDPSAHSHNGLTLRNQTMFGPPGRLYAYRSYGIHTCVNLVCAPEGDAAAVLLRAFEPTCGLVRMRQLRGLARSASDRLIARGPGRLAQALDLRLEDDGMSALGGDPGDPRPDKSTMGPSRTFPDRARVASRSGSAFETPASTRETRARSGTE